MPRLFFLKYTFLLLFSGFYCFGQDTIHSTRNIDSIIDTALAHSSRNDPLRALNFYSYETYEKIVITDSIDRPGNAHAFFAEKVSHTIHEQGKGFKEEVLGINMAGFEEPRYEVLAITLQSRSFYDEDFKIFNYRYAGPLSKRGRKNYNYRFLKDTVISGRKSYAISISPKRPKTIPGLAGTIWLDASTLALQKATIDLDADIEAQIEREYIYVPEHDIYLPRSNKLYIEGNETSKRLSLFRGKVSVGTIENAPVEETIEGKFLISTLVNTDFKFEKEKPLKSPDLAIEIMEGAQNQPESFWQSYRNEALSEQDVNSFDFLEDVVEENKIERRLSVINNFGIGYYAVNFFDFDLTYPIKYNNYEGLRLGLGGLTNAKFSKHFRLQAYAAYGFKDAAFKYGIGGGVLLNESHGAWLSIAYGDDLQEVGSYNYLTDRRVYSLFEPRLVNITQFFDYRTLRLNQEYHISSKILSELQLSKTDVEQTTAYRFLNDGEIYRNYSITEATFGLRWSPSSKFMRSEKGTVEIYDGYPKITAQVSQGFADVLDGDFDFTRFGAKVFYRMDRLNKSATEFLVEGKMAFGELPLTHLFHAYPNAPTKETIMQRFSVAGINSFETMFFGEFFSDRIATLQIKHRLRPFDLGPNFQPQMVFITRYAIGDIQHPENHLDVSFDSLEKGYSETGFEINRILFGFGTSFTYRHGAYHLPNFEDNIAFKFTFYLTL